MTSLPSSLFLLEDKLMAIKESKSSHENTHLLLHPHLLPLPPPSLRI
jgi:hypothetical protein